MPGCLTSRHSRKRSQRKWLRRDQTVTSPRSRSAPAMLASLSIICGTAAAPPQLQPTRRGLCRGRRFRHPSIGTNFHPDFVRTTSQSETCCIGCRLSNKILGRAFSRFVNNYRNSAMDGSEKILYRKSCLDRPCALVDPRMRRFVWLCERAAIA
jgi:hypothetical protein